MIATQHAQGTIYQGTPAEIIVKVAAEIAEALQKAGIGPSGVHTLALVHLAACMRRGQAEANDPASVPSFDNMLQLLVHGMTGSTWTEDETRAFDQAFQTIVESYGGHKVGTKIGNKMEGPMILSPSLGVH